MGDAADVGEEHADDACCKGLGLAVAPRKLRVGRQVCDKEAGTHDNLHVIGTKALRMKKTAERYLKCI